MAARGMVVDGVLLPAEMWEATLAEQQEYAAQVKKGNSAVITAYFQLEDAAAKLGLTMAELEDQYA